MTQLFDSHPNEYATAGTGVGAEVVIDFLTPQTMDRVILVTRLNAADVIGKYRLIFSSDTSFDIADPFYEFEPAGSNGAGTLFSFPATTARYVKWAVVTSTGTTQNLGGTELRFLFSPSRGVVAPAAVIGGSTPFGGAASPDYALSFASDGKIGRGVGNEYASAGAGLSTFVDFDFGAPRRMIGADFFDRITRADRVSGFSLTLSNNPVFPPGASVTQTFAVPLNEVSLPQWGTSAVFNSTLNSTAYRYARFQVTARPASTSTNNQGMAEMVFYARTETVSAVAVKTSSYIAGSPPHSMIDGSGLNGGLASADLSERRHFFSPTGNGNWKSGTIDGGLGGPLDGFDKQTVEFDLGREFSLKELYIWNFAVQAVSSRGVNQYEIWTSPDTTGAFTRYGGTYQLSPSNQGQESIGILPQVVPVSIDRVRRVQLKILNNHLNPPNAIFASEDYVGLAEVHFGTSPVNGPELEVVGPDEVVQPVTVVNGTGLNYTMGAIALNGTVTKSFTIKNRGLAPLTLSAQPTFLRLPAGIPAVHSRMSVAPLANLIIEPLGSRSVNVSYNPIAAAGLSQNGFADLRIVSDDADESPQYTRISTAGLDSPTFASAALPLVVPDHNAATPTQLSVDIPVSGLNATEVPLSIEVTLGFEPKHRRVSDLKAVLQSPSGINHTLFDRTGNTDDSDFSGDYTFSDTATGNLWTETAARSDGQTLNPGSYRTSNSSGQITSLLASFAGLSGATANGTWKVILSDHSTGEIAQLSQLKVRITTGNAPNLFVERFDGPSAVEVPHTSTITIPESIIGQISSQSFRLTNLGNLPLTGISVVDSDDSAFAHDALTITTLAPGQSTAFTLHFMPGTTGSKIGALTISSNDPDTPNFGVNLQGEAVPRYFNATPNSGIFPVEIPDGAGFNSAGAPAILVFSVSGLTSPLTEIQVTLGVQHGWVENLTAQLNLTSTGASHTLFSRVGKTAPSSANSEAYYNGFYRFNDNGTGNLWAAAANNFTTISDLPIYRTTGNSASATSLLGTFGATSVNSLNGNWTISVRDFNNTVTGQLTGARLYFKEQHETFAIWKAKQFTPAQLLNPAISGATADPDGDGSNNLLAYLMGHPATGATAPATMSAARVIESSIAYLDVIHFRPSYLPPSQLATGRVSYQYQLSPDLTTWTDVTPISEILGTATSTGSPITVRLPLPSAANHHFVRLKGELQ